MAKSKTLLTSLQKSGIPGVSSLKNKSLSEKLAWVIIIVFSFMYSGYMIRSTIIDWNKNPVITTIASTSIPVQKLQFPSITVCPEELTEFDRWAFIEEVFNNVQSSTVRPNVDGIIETFGRTVSFMFARMFSEITLFVYEILKTYELEDLETYSKLNDLELIIARKVAELSLQSQEAASAMLRESALRAVTAELIRLSYLEYDKLLYEGPFLRPKSGLLKTIIWPMFKANFPTLEEENHETSSLNNTDSILAQCKKASNCKQQLKRWHIFLVGCSQATEILNFGALKHAGDKFFGGFGTFLAHFSRYIGWSFQIRPGFTDYTSALEQEMSKFLVSLYDQLGGQNKSETIISLFDVPIILGFAREWTKKLHDDFVLGMTMPYYTSKSSSTCNVERMADYYNKWVEYMLNATDSAVHPCKGSNISSCCHYYGKIFASSFEETLKIMRFASPQGKGSKNKTHLEQLFGQVTLLGHVYKSAIEVTENADFLMQLIPMCKYALNDVNYPCNLFEPMLTSRGICHSFNSESVSRIFRPLPYMRSFNKVFNTKSILDVDNALGTGDKFGLTFLLDGHTKMRHPSTQGTYNKGCHYNCEYKSSFTVSVNSKATPFDHYKNTFTVQPGMHTIIKVMPAEVTATEGLKSLGLTKRNCRFEDESDILTLFTNYTHSGCQFECMLNHSKNHCGCIPWNYPQAGNVEEICDMFGNMCFYQKMKDIDELNRCECLSDCNMVSFTYSETILPIWSQFACHQSIYYENSDNPYDYSLNIFAYIERYITSKYKASMFALSYENMEEKQYSRISTPLEMVFKLDMADMCDKALTYDISMVTVKLGSSDFVQSVQSKRTTFADQLAALGGIIGLFTGMSILSFFEVAFWIVSLFSMFLIWCQVSKRSGNRKVAKKSG